MKIFIDIDDTLTNMTDVLLGRLNYLYHKNYKKSDITYWDWYGDTFGTRCFKPLADSDFWKHVTVDPTAVSVIESLVLSGNEVYLCTASAFTPSLGHKIQTTLKPFNPDILSEKNVIICEDKWLLAGKNRVLIDDRALNCQRFRYEGGESILFNQPWNTSTYHSDRAYAWEDIEDLLKNIYR